MSRIGRTYQEVLNEREHRINPELLTTANGYTMYEDKDDFKKNTQYNTILTGTLVHDKLSLLFFSHKNIENIQKVMRFSVFKETDFKIGKQSETELLVIMRSIFLEHANHNLTDYTHQIKTLNNIVIDEIIPKLVVEVKQYKQYLVDKASPYQMLERPVSVSSAGTRVLNLDSGRGF